MAGMDTEEVVQMNAAIVAELRAEMAAQNRTVTAFSEDSGISRASMMRYLNGDRSLTTPTLMKLLQVLGVGMTEFFTRVERRAER